MSPRQEADAPEEHIPNDHLLTHFPKLSTCEICQRSNAQSAPCRRTRREPAGARAGMDEESDSERAAKFGELITADHAMLGDQDEFCEPGGRVISIVKDAATRWIDCYPSVQKSADETVLALKNVAGSSEVIRLYSDNSGELEAAARRLV